MLLDFFRGRQVDALNLKGLDRVVFVTCLPGSKTIMFRQYSVKLKRSGEVVANVHVMAGSCTRMGQDSLFFVWAWAERLLQAHSGVCRPRSCPQVL